MLTTTLNLTAILILVLTDLWVVIDSSRKQVAQNPKKPFSAFNGPVTWLIVCIVLWAVAFPVYLYRRARTLRERGEHTGASSAVTWIGVVLTIVTLACTILPFVLPQQSTAERLRDTVSASIQQTFQSNPAQKNIRVKSLTLAHESADLYKGLLVADVSGKEETHVVDVNYDGANIKWQIR